MCVHVCVYLCTLHVHVPFQCLSVDNFSRFIPLASGMFKKQKSRVNFWLKDPDPRPWDTRTISCFNCIFFCIFVLHFFSSPVFLFSVLFSKLRKPQSMTQSKIQVKPFGFELRPVKSQSYTQVLSKRRHTYRPTIMKHASHDILVVSLKERLVVNHSMTSLISQIVVGRKICEKKMNAMPTE